MARITGTPANDTLNGTFEDDLISGFDGDDVLGGRAGADTLMGGNGADTLEGGVGDDHLIGGQGDDLLVGGAGDDTLDGRVGRDIASFEAANGPVTVDLGAGSAVGHGNDVLISINRIIGTSFADLLIGGSNRDLLFGGLRSDTLIGGAGDDFLHGGNGPDRISGRGGDDRVVGGNGDDTLIGGRGDDTLDGRGGFDRAVIPGDRGGHVIIRNADGSVTIVDADPSDGDLGTDRLISIDLWQFADREIAAIETHNNLGEVAAGTVPGLSAFRLVGEQPFDQAGFAVAAGDIDGDGIADLLVTAPSNFSSYYEDGAVYLVFGGQDFGALADSSGDIWLGTIGSPGGLAGFRFVGQDYEIAGASVTAAGDVNGDGFVDLIVGALHHYDQSNGLVGGAYLVFGGQDFSAFVNGGAIDLGSVGQAGGPLGFRFVGEKDHDHVGISVSSAGDVNGDGFADLVVGAYGVETGGEHSGSVYIVFGGQDFSALATDGAVGLGSVGQGLGGFELVGAPYDEAGFAVASAGDVNGDGIADIVVSAYNHAVGGVYAGAAYVIFGGQDFADLAGADGEIDLGTVGQARGPAGFKLVGEEDYDGTGFAISTAGDVNGDGVADLVVTAPGNEDGGYYGGATYLIFGGQDFAALANADGEISLGTIGQPGGVAGVQFTGGYGSGSGVSATLAGDVNGDGFDDLIVGAFLEDIASYGHGAAYVVFGGQDLAAIAGADGEIELATIGQAGGPAGFRLFGAAELDLAGVNVSSAGDINGDGLADLTVTAASYSSLFSSVYVVYGDDFSQAIDQFGSDFDDLLQGTGADESLIGGLGNDTLVGGGGADVLYGGAGDDVLAVADAEFFRLNGGGGQDTLRLDGAFDLDLTAISNMAVREIEAIDMRNGGSNTLTLDGQDVFDFSSIPNGAYMANSHNSLVIDGDAGDQVILAFLDAAHPLAAALWELSGAPVTIGGENYSVYELTLDDAVFASVAIHEDVTVAVT